MQRLVREIAQDTAKIFITKHAKARMKQRSITQTQVFACLRNGSVSEPAHEDISGDWKCTLTHRHAGDEINVAAAIKKDDGGNFIAVVTVF